MAATTQTDTPRKQPTKRVREIRVARLVATNKEYAKICRNSMKRIPSHGRQRLALHAFDRWSDVTLGNERAKSEVETVFISRLSDIPDRIQQEAHAGPTSRYLLFLESLPVEAITPRILRLGVRNPCRLHIAREDTPAAISGVVHRMIAGMMQVDGPRRIADAWIEDGTLVLLSPHFERMRVPLHEIVRYIGNDPVLQKDFEIDEDGSFLYWPREDVHLGWEQLLYLIDPAAALATKGRTAKFNKNYGAAIRSFREEHGLTQAEIQGLTDRHLRRIEKGEVLASKATLEALASSHGVSLAEYMKQIAKRIQS